jgi:hypothetical protein
VNVGAAFAQHVLVHAGWFTCDVLKNENLHLFSPSAQPCRSRDGCRLPGK